MTPEYHKKVKKAELDDMFSLLLGSEEEDDAEMDLMASLFGPMRPAWDEKKKPEPADVEAADEGMQDVYNELFMPAQQRVPYPDFLVNELRQMFRNNYKFIDSLNSGEANAIKYLSNLPNYTKPQIDAYMHLYLWLIQNNIILEDVPLPGDPPDDLEDPGDAEEDDPDDEFDEEDEYEEQDDAEEAEMQEGDEEDEDGDKQDSSKSSSSKSKKQQKKIKKSKDGKVGKPSPQRMQQLKDAYEQNKAQKAAQAPPKDIPKPKGDIAKKDEKVKKSIWQTIKEFMTGQEQTMPQSAEEKANAEAEKKELERKETVRRLSQVMKEVEKDFSLIENDSDGKEKLHSEQDGERHELVSPGGRGIRALTAKEIVKEWIDRVAQSGIHLRTAGYEKWDKRKIAKYSVTNRQWLIPHAKYKNLPDKIMFQLDFSGSCSWISKTFAQLGQEACKYSHVVVAYGGWEGYVQGFITPTFSGVDAERALRRSGSTGLGYGDPSDHIKDMSLGEYLHHNRDIKTVFILGDYDGTQRYVDAYYRHRSVRFIWLCCERAGYFRGGTHLGPFKNHIHYFDGTVEGLSRIVHRIKI